MMVSSAVELAYECAGDNGYVPSEMDITLLGRLCETLWQHYFMANHLLRIMLRRMKKSGDG